MFETVLTNEECYNPGYQYRASSSGALSQHPDAGNFGLSSSRPQFQQNSPHAAYNNTADQSLPFQFSGSHPGHNSAFTNQPRMDTRPSMDQSRSDNNLFQHPSAPHQNSSNGSTPSTSLRQSTSSTATGARPSGSAIASGSSSDLDQGMHNLQLNPTNQHREYICILICSSLLFKHICSIAYKIFRRVCLIRFTVSLFS